MPWSRVGSLLISNFGDPQITVADLQELIARGDTFNDKLLYSSANLHGTAQYWHQRRILQTKGKEVNLAEDSNAPFKVIQENTHVVTSYFDLRNQAYHDKVLKPVFGVSGCFYCYEFAKFRVKFIGTNSAGGETGDHISYFMKLVKMVAKRKSVQLDLVGR